MYIVGCLMAASMARGTFAQSSSSDGLGAFLSDAYSVVSQVKSIVTETASPSTTKSSASSASSRSPSPSSSMPSSSAASISLPLTSLLPTSTQQNAPSSPTTTSADAPLSHHHGINKLAIILGIVIGFLVLVVLALLLCCCIRRRRRTRTSRRIMAPDDDEFDAWRGGHQRESLTSGWRPPRATGNYTHVSSDALPPPTAPDLSHHPAFKNSPNDAEMSQQPTNPFVPVPPAPRRSAPNSRPGLTDTSQPGQEPFIARHPGATAAAAGIGGAALGAAAADRHHRKSNESPHSGILRKPVPNNSYEKLDQRPDPEAHCLSNSSPYAYGHHRDNSSAAAPLMTSNNADPEKHTYEASEANLPTHYTSERPATPMGLLAFGGGRGKGNGNGNGNGKSNDLHHGRSKPEYRPPFAGTDDSVESSTSRSYDSAHSTSSVAVVPAAAAAAAAPATARKAHSVTPPTPTARSPKRTRFSDSVEEWDGRYSGGSRSGSGSRTDSGERLSGSMPGGWWGGNGSERSSRAAPTPVSPLSGSMVGHPAGAGAGGRERRQSLGRRLRLSDLRAEQEEEAARLRSGYHGHGHGDDGWADVDVGRAY